MQISVIIPLYNEADSLPKLFEWIRRVMNENNFSYEVIFVDDGSDDASWSVIESFKQHYDNVSGIRFRKNYGKSPALFCGFGKAKGDVVITLDADLQDSPDEIPELYRMIVVDGYDLVSGWKKKRYDNAITKNIPSKIYNAFARKVTGIKLHDMNCGLKAYRNDVVKNIEVYGEMHRYIPYLAKNAGFSNIGEKIVEHRKREFGHSKFGLERFVNGYLDLFSLWFLNKFGKKPMHFFWFWWYHYVFGRICGCPYRWRNQITSFALWHAGSACYLFAMVLYRTDNDDTWHSDVSRRIPWRDSST